MKSIDDRELEAFVAHEARLLDTRAYDEWLSLFTDDGRYWVPLAGESQTEFDAHNSIADEDRLLMSMRVARLRNPRAHSQHPPSACQHVLQSPIVYARDHAAGRYELRTSFVYVEARGEQQIVLAGTCMHLLVVTADSLRIRLKRVNLLNCGAALTAIQLFL